MYCWTKYFYKIQMYLILFYEILHNTFFLLLLWRYFIITYKYDCTQVLHIIYNLKKTLIWFAYIFVIIAVNLMR